MRIDKFLKVSRIIKRRTVAAEACEQGKISVNGKVAGKSTTVKIGDIIEIAFGEKILKVEVMNLAEHVLKADAGEMYRQM